MWLRRPSLAVLSFTALGVVYGDIGTSPLYAFREAFHPARRRADGRGGYGILSMIVWSLISSSAQVHRTRDARGIVAEDRYLNALVPE